MIELKGWALTLGASSGFGEAVSLALARAGLNIFGVHLDRKATLGNVERITGEINALGREAVFFNVNAADAEKRAEIAGQMAEMLERRGEPGTLRVLLHHLGGRQEAVAIRPSVIVRAAIGVLAAQLKRVRGVVGGSCTPLVRPVLTNEDSSG